MQNTLFKLELHNEILEILEYFIAGMYVTFQKPLDNRWAEAQPQWVRLQLAALPRHSHLAVNRDARRSHSLSHPVLSIEMVNTISSVEPFKKSI